MKLPPGFVLEQPTTSGINLPPGFELETAAPVEKQSIFRQVADVPLGIAKGAVQGVRMIADVFGAGSETSNTIRSAENYLADLMSAQAKNDQQAIARIMKDAEDKGVVDQVLAGVKAFTVAPVDTLSTALGTAAPVIAGALGAKLLGAGALVGTGVGVLTGAGMGAGVVKGSIYDETKKALLEAGASEEEAERRAQLAQEYRGQNLDQILLGTVLGGAAAAGPLEKGAAGILARRILGKAAVEETGEAAVAEAAKGAVRRRLEAGAKEAIPELTQAAQEQVAQNIALQREGFDVPTFRGAVSAATLEGLAGGALGATIGGGKPEIAPPQAEIAPPAAPPAEPTVPPTLRERVEEVTGVTTPPAEVAPLTAEEAEAAGAARQREIAERARIGRLQQMAEADMEAQAERARREGIAPVTPPRAETPERTVPPLAEREMPQATPMEELRAKQAEVDRRRLEAGLPTGESSMFPGFQPRPPLEAEPEKPAEPTLVDERPMTEKAAKNRLLVLKNLYKNAGRDPESIDIVPHPTVPERFAIQSLDRPVKLTPGLPETAAGKEPSPKVIDPVEAYVNIQRRTNTDAARRFVQDWDAGKITRADVEQALEQEKKSGRPPALTYTAEGEREIEPADQYKPRGERLLPPAPPLKPPTDQETPPTETETTGEEPPPPTVAPPKTLEEFKQRMPIVQDSAKVRAANKSGSFENLADALASSQNPVVARIGELARKISKEVTLLKPKSLGSFRKHGRTYTILGQYNPYSDTIQMIPKTAGDEWTNTHEVVHALLVRSQRNPTPRQKPIVKQIEELYRHVYNEVKKRGMNPNEIYGLTDPLEFVSEASSNAEFQFMLMSIPYKGKRSAWTEFTKLVANLLGFKDPNALSEVLNLIDKLGQTTRAPFRPTFKGETIFTKEGERPIGVAVPEASFMAAPEKEEGEAPALPAGAKPMDVVGFMGITPQKQEESTFDRTKRLIKEAKEDPEFTKSSIAQSLSRLKDQFENNVFSNDSAFNNKVRSELIKDIDQNKDVLGALIEMSQSQTVHSDALAGVFIQMGGLRYDKEAKKWVGFEEKNNYINLSRKIDDIAAKYKLTKDEAMRVAHANFIARRLRSVQDRNAEIETEIANLPKGDEKIAKLKDSIVKIHLNDDQIQAGLDLSKTMPELNDVFNIWNGIRTNTVKLLVQSGMWSDETANAMLDVIDYVPFYREEQLEVGEGPKEFVRGLQVKAKEYRLKGSDNPVNDVFDNMVRWTQYAINRSIRNHKSLQLVDQAVDIDVIDGKMAEKIEKPSKIANDIVRVWRDGKQEYYRFADPLFADAFLPIQNVSIPSLKIFSWFANLLRQSVVLYPLFSVAQVPQDSFAAMFSSGLQPKFALRIPFLAVKEFVQTLTKTSATHNQLKKYGAVGVRDFTSTVIRDDAEIVAGLKKEEGWVKNAIAKLGHISMSADNAVRQAVYDAAMQQGLSKAEALEKAFDIINFRRRPKSMLLNIAGQTIPFFYAYLAAQRVAYNTVTGVGISPQERKAGLKTLAYTSAAVMSLSFLYAMMNEDDEEYRDTPTALRDRTLTVPGTDGVRIPLRPDFFLFPKIIGEHMYHLITENGLTDPAKFRTTMKDAVIQSVASPGPFPQAVKPVLEAAINYNFFTGRPLIGFFDQKKEAERQFNDSTSEFAKVIGSTGLVSPIVVDHLVRGMFGSVGGLFLWGTNSMIQSDPNVERPELTWRDAAAALPGTSGLLSRPSENALKNDFYLLRDEVEKAKNTFNDYKKYSPEGLEEYVSNEKVIAKLALAKSVEKVSNELSKVRAAIKQINQMPSSMISAEEKEKTIKELRQAEKDMLKAAGVPEMRKAAQL